MEYANLCCRDTKPNREFGVNGAWRHDRKQGSQRLPRPRLSELLSKICLALAEQKISASFAHDTSLRQALHAIDRDWPRNVSEQVSPRSETRVGLGQAVLGVLCAPQRTGRIIWTLNEPQNHSCHRLPPTWFLDESCKLETKKIRGNIFLSISGEDHDLCEGIDLQ